MRLKRRIDSMALSCQQAEDCNPECSMWQNVCHIVGTPTEMTIKILILITSTLFLSPHWTVQTSGVNVRLRGVSAVSESVAWASGAGATVLRTADGGATWRKLKVSDDPLDFRDIDAVNAET